MRQRQQQRQENGGQSSPLSQKSMNIEANRNQLLSIKSQKQSQSPFNDKGQRISNLKWPTKISRNGKGLTHSKTDAENFKDPIDRKIKQANVIELQSKPLNLQICTSKEQNPLDTSIQTRYTNIIKNLEDEINSSILPPRSNAQSTAANLSMAESEDDHDRQNIEDELEKMKQALALIKEQENMLITRISRDVTQEGADAQLSQFSMIEPIPQDQNQLDQTCTFNEDSCVLIQDDQTDQNSKHRSHHRRISRQSFGCRSFQELNHSLQQLETQTSMLKKVGNFQISINDTLSAVDAAQIQTPRTNVEVMNPLNQSEISDNQLAQLFNCQNAIQTPFFSRGMNHVKKESIVNDSIIELMDPIMCKMQENQDIRLREISHQNRQSLRQDDSQSINLVRKEHAFNTSRNQIIKPSQSDNTEYQSITPRDSILKNVYTSQRSSSKNANASQSKSRTRNNFDYSKISKHQSIAKIFESIRISKKQSEEKQSLSNTVILAQSSNQSQFEMKRSSTTNYLNLSGRQSMKQQIINFEKSDQKSARGSICPDQRDNTNAQTCIEKPRLSISRDRSSNNLSKNQTASTKNLKAFLTNNIGNSTSRIIQQERQSLLRQPSKDYLAQIHQNLPSSRGCSLAKSTLNDHSIVKQRRMEMEQERQVKLIQKVQQKDQKINHLVGKKSDEEKNRKENHNIYEKSMRLKQRVDDRRKVFNNTSNTNQNNHNLVSHRQVTQNTIADERQSKTPSRQRNAFNKPALQAVVNEIEQDRDHCKRVSVSPYKFDKSHANQKSILDKAINNRNQFRILPSLGYKPVLDSTSTSSLNLSAISSTHQHSRHTCENCQKLFSKGLSSNYCPMHMNYHAKQLSSSSSQNLPKHSHQPSEFSMSDIADANINRL